MRRKVEESPIFTGEQEEDTGVSLNLVEATDSVEPPKKSKLKDSIKSLFVTEEETEKPVRRKKKSTFFVKHIYLFTGTLIFLCNVIWPEEWKESFFVEDKEYSLAPNQEHINAIIEPLARIADRHTHIADVNPDVTDIFTSITAMVAYGLEIRSILSLKRYYENEEKKKQEKQEMRRFI
jgi:hypothetical protein